MDNQPLWYKNAVFYEVYVRAFYDSNGDGHGDLRGLAQKLDYLQELGIDCLWLMPIYPSPLKDDGYDIADYYGILDRYGTLEDFKFLLDEAHRRDLRIITDLVLNHVSDQIPWFQSARRGRNAPYRDYFVWSDTDQKYKEARIIFIDTEKSNWTYDEPSGQYYWHRFYASQPDLNYSNPAVQDEMLRVAKYWLDLGVDGFRADAVPYLFEREGTSCENLPETHDYLKRLRQFIDQNYPGKILLCEANQWPEDVRPYFGDGDEFHMGFHFPVMPRIFMALRKEDKASLVWILDRTPPIPADCQWCTFLRNHDELTLEMVTEEEREWMWQEYAPETRMRLNLGIRRRLAPLLDNDRRKIELANSLLFTLPGSPILYYGDEIGMGDNINLPDRNGVRTPMQWDSSPLAGFSSSADAQSYANVIRGEPFGPEWVNVRDQQQEAGSLWHTLRRMIAVRKMHPAFAWGDFAWAENSDPALAAYWRKTESEKLLVINNLSGKPQRYIFDQEDSGLIPAAELLSGRVFTVDDPGQREIVIAPYQYLWLQLKSGA
jgi:maltose alpha-D-glucosyltransferase/alpha-amylase